MAKLVGIDDRADVADLPPVDLQRHHADQPARGIDESGPRLTVDLAEAKLAAQPRCLPGPVANRARDAAAAAQRLCQRRGLAAAVAVEGHVLGQQRLQPTQIALLRGGEEAPRQLLALLPRG